MSENQAWVQTEGVSGGVITEVMPSPFLKTVSNKSRTEGAKVSCALNVQGHELQKQSFTPNMHGKACSALIYGYIVGIYVAIYN